MAAFLIIILLFCILVALTPGTWGGALRIFDVIVGGLVLIVVVFLATAILHGF